MAKSVGPIYTMPICNNKYISGWELQHSLCNGYFLGILNNSFCCQVSHYFTPCLLNVSCVSNILPRLIKLTLLYQVSLCRLVYIINLFSWNSVTKGRYFQQNTQNIKKKKIVYFLSIFLKKLKTCKYNS